jgi:hypothetical protein
MKRVFLRMENPDVLKTLSGIPRGCSLRLAYLFGGRASLVATKGGIVHRSWTYYNSTPAIGYLGLWLSQKSYEPQLWNRRFDRGSRTIIIRHSPEEDDWVETVTW